MAISCIAQRVAADALVTITNDRERCEQTITSLETVLHENSQLMEEKH